tara:strand:+ start:110 stop:352 length:243 start_codon:yes stop_codon:yes gene_type:complete
MTHKVKTNTELLNEIMEFAPTGAMSQMFVIDALTRQAAEVIKQQDTLRDSMKDHIINPDAWIRTAEWIEAKLNSHYGENK